MQMADSSTGSIVSTIPWIENGEPREVAAVLGVRELDTQLTSRRVHAALVLTAEAEAERRWASERGGVEAAGIRRRGPCTLSAPLRGRRSRRVIGIAGARDVSWFS